MVNQPKSNTKHCKRKKLTRNQQLGDRSAAALLLGQAAQPITNVFEAQSEVAHHL
jgi:hypothetical protein